MALTYFEISYPNFVLGAIIDPAEANQNNHEIVDKINNMITANNNNETNINNLGTAKADKSYVDDKDTIITQSITTHKTSGDHDSRYYTETEIDGKITTINNSLSSNATAIANHKTSADHDVRYYTKGELEPWLRGGDTTIKEEVFQIITSNNGDGTFTYTKDGVTPITGTLLEGGQQVFTLTEGNYNEGLNRLEVYVNDTLRRTVKSGGVLELSTTTLALTSPEGNGAEITVRYYERVGMASEYNIKLSAVKPPANNGKTMWFKLK